MRAITPTETAQELPPTADNDFPRLIAEARAGCREAFGELVENCRSYLLLVANDDLDPHLRTKEAASDIVQDALVSAQQDLGSFRGSTRREWLSWLRMILKNDLLEANRRYRGTAKRALGREISLERKLANDSVQADQELSASAQTPSTLAVLHEQAEVLADAIGSLSSDYREVIRLRNWEQLSFAEIGERMERSAEAARKLWARAIVQLQTVMVSEQPKSTRSDP